MLSTWGYKTGGGTAPVTGTPAFDSNAASKQFKLFSTGSSTTLPAMTTNQSPDTIVVMIAYEYTALTPTVNSVTGTGLSFTKRGSVLNTTVGAHGCSIEFWSAQSAAPLSAVVISVGWTSAIDDSCIGAWAVNATYGAVPWDSNGGLPATIFNTTAVGPPTSTYSTSKNDDMIFYSIFNSQGQQADPTDPSGWTLIFPRATFVNGGGSNFSSGAVWYKSVSAPQTNQTVVSTQATAQISWTAYVDALTGDS